MIIKIKKNNNTNNINNINNNNNNNNDNNDINNSNNVNYDVKKIRKSTVEEMKTIVVGQQSNNIFNQASVSVAL